LKETHKKERAAEVKAEDAIAEAERKEADFQAEAARIMGIHEKLQSQMR
jgi:hypothetical protein